MPTKIYGNRYHNSLPNKTTHQETTHSTPEENSRNFFNDKKNNSKNNQDDYFFELFGLKLYFDDVLLLSLHFFLYQEGVKDDELFISLALLLLT